MSAPVVTVERIDLCRDPAAWSPPDRFAVVSLDIGGLRLHRCPLIWFDGQGWVVAPPRFLYTTAEGTSFKLIAFRTHELRTAALEAVRCALAARGIELPDPSPASTPKPAAAVASAAE